jgi:DNA-binding PadR family transcriptional regulator
MKPIDVLRTQLLLVLEQEPGLHGYAVHKLVAARGVSGGAERTYRALRGMDADGLVQSKRAKSPEGPDRRNYEVTERGRARLAGLVAEADSSARVLYELVRDAEKLERGRS